MAPPWGRSGAAWGPSGGPSRVTRLTSAATIPERTAPRRPPPPTNWPTTRARPRSAPAPAAPTRHQRAPPGARSSTAPAHAAARPTAPRPRPAKQQQTSPLHPAPQPHRGSAAPATPAAPAAAIQDDDDLARRGEDGRYLLGIADTLRRKLAAFLEETATGDPVAAFEELALRLPGYSHRAYSIGQKIRDKARRPDLTEDERRHRRMLERIDLWKSPPST
ncbi:hypothetical protein [Kitasatospora sp. NPDC059817]|uniref:hypothetical protein n=1 Tax=Kitasatospora sp. NPDC059817 TaxID=3346961 RepID=UPI00364BAF11